MPTYSELILARGDLVAYWRLREASGTTAADASGNGRAGSVVGSVTLGGAAGIDVNDPGPAAAFATTTNGGIQAADHASLNFAHDQPFSIALLARFDHAGLGTGSRSLLAKTDNATNQRGWALSYRPDLTASGTHQFEFRHISVAGTAWVYAYGQATFAANSVHAVVATYDGSGAASGVRIYVDGVALTLTDGGSSIGSGATSNTRPVSIGARDGLSHQFRGAMQEASLHSGVISGAEAAALYEAALVPAAPPDPGGPGTGIVAYRFLPSARLANSAGEAHPLSGSATFVDRRPLAWLGDGSACAAFDGSAALAAADASSLRGGGVAFWGRLLVRFDELPAGSSRIALARWDASDAANQEWYVGWNGSALRFHVKTPTGSTGVNFGVAPTAGRWYHVLFGSDGTKIYLSVDGETPLEATPTGGVQAGAACPLTIGRLTNPAADSGLRGRVAEVAYEVGRWPDATERALLFSGGRIAVHPYAAASGPVDPPGASVFAADGFQGYESTNAGNFVQPAIDSIVLGGVEYQAAVYATRFGAGGGKFALATRSRSVGGTWSAWSHLVFDGAGGRPDWEQYKDDVHPGLWCQFDATGVLHLMGNVHANAPVQYRRTSGPIAGWGGGFTGLLGPLVAGAGNWSYPTPFRGPDGTLYAFWRIGSSSVGRWHIASYDTATQLWSPLAGTGAGGALVDYEAAADNPYFDVLPGFTPAGDMWVTWVRRQESGSTVNVDIHAIRWDRAAGTWHRVGGAAQTVPITVANKPADIAVPPGDGLSNAHSATVDPAGRPHVAYLRNDGSGYCQIWHSWHDGTSWQSSRVSDTTAADWTTRGTANAAIGRGQQDLRRPLFLMAHDGTARLYAAVATEGNTLQRWSAPPPWTGWTREVLLGGTPIGWTEARADFSRWRRSGVAQIHVAPHWGFEPLRASGERIYAFEEGVEAAPLIPGTLAAHRHGDPVMIDYTPASAVAAGAVVLLGNTAGLTCGVAHRAIEAGALGALAVGGGVYEARNLDNAANFAKVWWDVENEGVTTASTNNALFGFIVSGGGGGANSACHVLHRPYA